MSAGAIADRLRPMDINVNRKKRVGFVAALGLLAVSSTLFTASAGNASAAAEHLYVAPWGRDTWPGTMEQPLATPAGAQEVVRELTAEMDADIVVNLRGGEYALTEPLRFSAAAGDTGTGGHTVVYQAFGYGTSSPEVPTISGGRDVTGWRRAKNLPGVWRANVGSLETRQLFVDGRRAQRTARGRGLPGREIQLPNGFAVHNTVPQSWQRGRDIELVFNGGKKGLPYSEARCGVARIRGDAEWTRIIVDEPCFGRLKKAYDAEAPGAIPPAPTDVENSLTWLRDRGSWYLDRSRPGHHVLYYMPRREEDPREIRVIAPVLQKLVMGEGLHDIAFRGLTFSHATWLTPNRPRGWPQIIGSWYYAKDDRTGRMPGHVTFRAAERIEVEGNHFTQLGGGALVLSGVGSDNTVHNNVVDDVSGGGIEVRGSGGNNRVEDNWVHRIGIDYRGSIGISLEGSPNSTVAHNQVNDVPYSGIWGESSRGLSVVGNLIFDAVGEVPDGGGIYLPFAQGTSFEDGAVVRGNVVRATGSVGIYPDVGADWVTVERNVIFGQHNAVSGVEPRRIVLANNYWDDAKPLWWPEDEPTPGVELIGNSLLERSAPMESCTADTTCADILAGAGRRGDSQGP
jgi:parallel beta-helix repeat protein